jgi:tetratricopeptide (TPR) repeat protein
MDEERLFPKYVPRQEEQEIRDDVARVRADRQSRALLLYGEGGSGKTWLVRALAESEKASNMTAWLDPVDVDDPEYWLLSNLEQEVAEQLDPQHKYFGPYLEYLSKLPDYAMPRIGHETIVSHLGRIKRVFVECYTRFIEASQKTVVMIFDTVETIRGVYLLYTLTQWMKALPGTLFILSGRPQGEPGDTDAIESELDDPYKKIPVRKVFLGEFSQESATEYLNSSRVAAGLSADETEALVLLSGGHPLWLAFAISYVSERGIPEEATTDLTWIRHGIPFGGDPTPEGRALQEAFKRRLVTPYRGADFWHEAVKRLAVVRQRVNKQIWLQLMSDRRLPGGVRSPDEAWEALKQTPWIRTRANGNFVTLHDAVAEELAYRIIPLHDQDQKWRRELWKRAAVIYSGLLAAPEAELAADLAAVDDRLRRLDQRLAPPADAGAPVEQEAVPESATIAAETSESIEEVARLDARKRELDQFRVIGLYYQMLSDFDAGSQQFLSLFGEAVQQNDVFLQDWLALEMQRFLPGAVHPYTLDDIIGGAISEFQRWLSADGRESYLKIGMDVAGYLIDNERPQASIGLLEGLPEDVADPVQLSRLRILKSNACMRIPEQANSGLPDLERALQDATALKSAKLIADAQNELGFYYRSVGLWRKADEAYEQARDAISASLARAISREDRENMASIHTNWAYLKGLTGRYPEGLSLVESAIDVRHRLKLYQQEGISWSVCGEVYRYERRFLKAWKAFRTAERIFQGQRNWSWLGTIYQQQAICLLQAMEAETILDEDREPLEHSQQLITMALDICRDQNRRAYPSALNRAGRIYGKHDFESGFVYLKEGVDWAYKLSDGWFWFANMIEYAELRYRAWVEPGDRARRDQIHRYEIDRYHEDVARAAQRYEFSDLEGRWELVHGHLGIHDALDLGDTGVLGAALENYKTGFVLLTRGSMGSSGITALGEQFEKFTKLFSQLSADVRAQWLEELRAAWSESKESATLLLSRLEHLY